MDIVMLILAITFMSLDPSHATDQKTVSLWDGVDYHCTMKYESCRLKFRNLYDALHQPHGYEFGDFLQWYHGSVR